MNCIVVAPAKTIGDMAYPAAITPPHNAEFSEQKIGPMDGKY